MFISYTFLSRSTHRAVLQHTQGLYVMASRFKRQYTSEMSMSLSFRVRVESRVFHLESESSQESLGGLSFRVRVESRVFGGLSFRVRVESRVFHLESESSYESSIRCDFNFVELGAIRYNSILFNAIQCDLINVIHIKYYFI